MPCWMCCIHSSKKGECEWYTYVYVWYPFVEERGVQMVYTFDIRVNVFYTCIEGREREWYTCVFVLYLFVEGRESEWYQGRKMWMVYMCDLQVNVCVPYSCIGHVACVWCCGHHKSWLLYDKYIKKNIHNYQQDIRVLIQSIFKENLICVVYKHIPKILNNGLK